MSQVKTLDFTGQSIFCGIDIHKKNWSVCLRSMDRELKTYSQNPDPVALVEHLNKNYPNASVSIVYEAGFCGFWPQQFFCENGFDCKIVNPSDVPQPDKSRRHKTDSVDCRKLALELSKQSLKSIHIPQPDTITNRSLVRSRQQLVQDQTRYKNRVISFLDFYGIQIPPGYKKSTHFSKHFLKWLEHLELNSSSKAALMIQVNCVKSVREQLMICNSQLRELSKSPLLHQCIELLMSIPGVGIQSSLIFATELEDIKRFKSFDHLASYAGFKPDIYSSSDTVITKGITYQCNTLLRETLIECAWIAIAKDPALTQAYYSYKKRMHYNKAIIRIGKKLLSRIRYVLIHKVPYQMRLVEK